MKVAFYLLILLTTFSKKLFTQDASGIIEKYKYKLFDEKKLKPFNTVRVNLEITTEDGKFPATLLLQENMIYKLEMKGKESVSIEYIDQNQYKLLNTADKTKKIIENSPELHIRKKIWLNFYPLIHHSLEFPIQNMANGMEMIVMPVVQTPEEPENINPGIKKFIQLLHINEARHVFYFDVNPMELKEIITRYNVNGEEKKDVFRFGNLKRSTEGYLYPEKFTTVFGEAVVKSIQFNPRLLPSELEIKF